MDVFGTRKAPLLYRETWPSRTSFFVFWSGSSFAFVVAQPVEMIARNTRRRSPDVRLFAVIICHPHVVGNFLQHFLYHRIVRREDLDVDPVRVFEFLQIN